jgi:thiamine transport system ATP-binding protein
VSADTEGSQSDHNREGATVRVTLDGVAKRYGETTALDGVSATVEDGEFFTLVGPSGCGKTTTLRLLAGFETPTSGTIRFDGQPVAGRPPEDRGVGLVFQNYALFPNMTVGENIAYGLEFADPPGGVSTPERVAELLELVDMAGTEDRDPEALSGGQQQRVALARALAPGPELLLLDEPMSALDARLRERLRVQVKAIQRALDITTVYVTHDQEEALAVSDRVAVMRSGEAEQVGTPREVYRAPSTRFVAEFVGDNNVLTGEVVATGSETDTVRVDDTALRVAAESRALSVGERVTFCVRPEDLLLDSETNRLRGTVASAEFLGETTRVHLEWAGRELLLRTSDPLDGEVTVGFEPDAAQVLDGRDR